jgi:serine/threonine protein kinase
MDPLLPSDPKKLGVWTLTGRLGKGGFGAVYMAHNKERVTVAIKVISGAAINDEKVSGTMAELDKAIAAKAIGEKLKIGIIRDGLPMTINLTLDRNPAVRYRFVSVDNLSKEQLLLRAKWLAL